MLYFPFDLLCNKLKTLDLVFFFRFFVVVVVVMFVSFFACYTFMALTLELMVLFLVLSYRINRPPRNK